MLLFAFILPMFTFAAQDTVPVRDSLSVNLKIKPGHDSLAVIMADTSTAGLEKAIVDILDSLVTVTFYNTRIAEDSASAGETGFDPGFIPEYTDSVYEERMSALNRETVVEMVYNRQVSNFIRLYAVKKKDLTAKIIGLSELYFPLFEEHLDRYNLPIELKYLAVVESALNPTAVSRAGAKGMWQFMYRTGKVYGLRENSLVDDRFDVLRSTDAACRHLKDLHDIYGDWCLAMAAYNSGAGNVNKAIRRAGGVKSYWAVWPFLPRETRGYVPAFMAVAYLMKYNREHNIRPVYPVFSFDMIDTVMISQPLSLEQVAEYLSIPESDLAFLNPAYKTGIIPSSAEKKYPLHLPREQVPVFIDSEKEIYAYKTESGIEKEKLLAEIKKAKERNIHVVRYGESLSVIASRYRCSVSTLKSWNNLRSNTIYPGQKLVVYAPGHYSPPKTAATDKSSAVTSGSVHSVRNGENLGLIAQKYDCSVADLRRWNNLTSNTIHPGQKLVVADAEQGAARNSQSAESARPEGKYVYHTIRKGDTLWDIAKLYKGVSAEEIRRLNNISNTHRLKPGQKLKIAVKS